MTDFDFKLYACKCSVKFNWTQLRKNVFSNVFMDEPEACFHNVVLRYKRFNLIIWISSQGKQQQQEKKGKNKKRKINQPTNQKTHNKIYSQFRCFCLDVFCCFWQVVFYFGCIFAFVLESMTKIASASLKNTEELTVKLRFSQGRCMEIRNWNCEKKISNKTPLFFISSEYQMKKIKNRRTTKCVKEEKYHRIRITQSL